MERERTTPSDEIEKALKLGLKTASFPLRYIFAPFVGKYLPKGTIRGSIYEFGVKMGWWK